MKRIGWIDAVRFIAIFHIVFIHVLDKFWPELLAYWVTPPYSLLPFLFCAKDAVLLFCVLLGFFASKPHRFSIGRFAGYTVKRYFQFSFFILCTGFVYVCAAYGVTWIFHSPDPLVYRILCDGASYNLIYVLRDAFLLEATYNPTLWSMQQFFFASILCYLIGCIADRTGPLVTLAVSFTVIAVLLLPGSEYLSWIAFCVMGVPVRIYYESRDRFSFMGKRGVRIALLVAAIVLYKLPESSTAYFMYGIASVLLLMICFHSPGVRRALDTAPLPALGRISFGVFILHTPVNSILYSSFYPFISALLPAWGTTLILFVLTLSISTGCSWLLDSAYSHLFRRFTGEKLRA